MHSEEYEKVLRETREQEKNKAWGHGLPSIRILKSYFRRQPSFTVLDYGSGVGNFKKAADGTGVEVTNYDPSIPEWSVLPDGPFDAVVSRHVLEHIEPDHLDATLTEIRERAKRLVYLTIPHWAAMTILSDGRNAHLIIENVEWWSAKLKQAFPETEWTHTIEKCIPVVAQTTTFVIVRKKNAVQ